MRHTSERHSNRALPPCEQIFAAVYDAVYLIDPETTNIIWCNRQGYEDLGYSADEVLQHSVLSLQKDVAGLPQWDEIKEVILANKVFRFIGRHAHKDGSEVAVEINTSHFVYEGRTYFVSVARNITKRLALELDLNSRNNRIWYALNAAADGFWEWQLEDNTVFFSDKLKCMLGYGPDEMAPHVDTWINNVHPDDFDRVKGILDGHLAGKRALYQARYRLKNRNGHYIWVEDKGRVCQRNQEGQPTHVVGMVRDITDHKKLEFQLENLAAYDPLTGLMNRREGEKQAERQFHLAMQNGTALGVAVIDLDFFKDINDLHGHQKGDRVLTYVGKLLQAQMRSTDILYRWGGEEFVWVLPLPDCDRMDSVVNKLHLVMQEADWSRLGIAPVTLSIGLACMCGCSAGFESLLHQADKAVYSAKEQGRNRTIVYDKILEN
jgi:diguanylate cyclase (GGDEF)-like protein/PAS domain S-box-containing protein